MSKKQDLFSAFPEISKAQWLEKIEKDLKGKPLQDLFWQLEENIPISPVYHIEDKVKTAVSTLKTRADNDWEIGGYIKVQNTKEANTQLLEGLRGGLMGVQLNVENTLTDAELEQLFDQVETDFISTHLASAKDPVKLFQQFSHLLNSRKKDPATTKGSLCFDPFERPDHGLDTALALIRDYGTGFAAFKFVQLRAPFYTGIENCSADLAQLLAKCSDLFAKSEENGIAPVIVARHLKLSLSIGTNFFVELAKLRALRLLWANLLKVYKMKFIPPEIEIHFAENTQKADGNNNMIQASTQAMAAVLGGAHRLFVRTSKSEIGDLSFQNRIARNVQHILKMESYLDRVVDPAAGSYYIDNLTVKLAEAAWSKFQEIEAKGGYGKVFDAH